MNCPKCGSSSRQAVKDTRTTSDGRIVRRRRCPDCYEDFTTTEQLSEGWLRVRKSDGRIVSFSRSAVLRSLREAAIRKYDPAMLNQLIDAVIESVYPASSQGIVDSLIVGEALLAQFRRVDIVSQIRFALVYRGRRDRGDGRKGWSTARDFREWLRVEYPEVIHRPRPTGLSEVCKRDGTHEAFDREKLQSGIVIAARGRGPSGQVDHLAEIVVRDVERELGNQPIVTSGQITAEILRSLRKRDHLAYLRFASTAKRYRDPIDYEAEAASLQIQPSNS